MKSPIGHTVWNLYNCNETHELCLWLARAIELRFKYSPQQPRWCVYVIRHCQILSVVTRGTWFPQNNVVWWFTGSVKSGGPSVDHCMHNLAVQQDPHNTSLDRGMRIFFGDFHIYLRFSPFMGCFLPDFDQFKPEMCGSARLSGQQDNVNLMQRGVLSNLKFEIKTTELVHKTPTSKAYNSTWMTYYTRQQHHSWL